MHDHYGVRMGQCQRKISRYKEKGIHLFTYLSLEATEAAQTTQKWNGAS
jgi:hypothetical protein